mgnify:CR=1 FL=1
MEAIISLLFIICLFWLASRNNNSKVVIKPKTPEDKEMERQYWSEASKYMENKKNQLDK